MRTVKPMALVILLTLTIAPAGCSKDPGPAAAMRAFADFQAALRQHDESGCRATLTHESAAALLDMPWDRVAQQKPVQILGATQNQQEYRVQVADPNAGGQHGEFVVVREYGRLVVDLVASAGLTAKTVEASTSKETLEPRQFTPADLDRIHQWELAQPAH